MPTIKHPQPRFSGYRLTDKGKAELYLPGQTALKEGQVKAEVLLPGETKPTHMDMKQDGDYWVSNPVPLGTDYRFRVNDTDKLEAQVAIKGQSPFLPASLTKKSGDNSVWEFTAPFAIGSHMVFQVPVKDDMPRVRAEKIVPGQNPEVLPVRKEGTNWVFSDPKGAQGTTYRLSPALDALEVVHHDQYGSFNRVSPHEMNSPQKSTVMADVFLDSVVPAQRLKELEHTERTQKGLPILAENEAHVPVLPMRNHFNQFAAALGGGQETGLNNLITPLKEAGVSSILLKPFIGGDNLSSHRYWTVDPYLLNSSFSSKTAFRHSLKTMLGNNMKLYADGAFVNQGLDGVQITSNLVHGFSSPFWRWLKYGDENTPGGPANFPGLAHKKYTFGVLPSRIDPKDKTGLPTLAMDSFAVRIINDPTARASQYDSRKPTFIELYDPRLEQANGQPITENLPIIKESTDSVQKYRFPVDPQEVIAKSKNNQLDQHSLMEWKRFRLDKSTGDDSAVKWDGQVNAAMLNTRNDQVVDYLKGAVGYWSRLVMNTHIGTVSEELHKARALKPNGTVGELVHHITKANADGEGILPPVTDEAHEALTDTELKHVFDNAAPDHTFQNAGKTFAKRLLEEVPMNVLPLPTLFKANLCYPGLTEALNPTQRSGFANFMSRMVLGTLSNLPLIGHVFKAIRNFFYPLPFQKALGEKMDHIFEQLDTKTQDKLRHNNMQSLLADRVGETLYLSLLTGLTPDQVKVIQENPKALEEAFYKGMPKDILQADPVVASKLLPSLLNQRLEKLSSHQMAKLVELELKNLDPRLAAVAEAVLQKREMGLNWRIDAARDVGDMSRVFDSPPDKRTQVFQEEINYVQKFWDKLAAAMRAPFPKTSIIAELTDFELLANKNKPVAAQAMKQLFDGNTFSGTPNMTHLYSPLMQFVNFAQRPDEHGKTQMGSGEFLNELQRMSEAVSFPALRQYQNMTTSHDYPTSSHALLINPDLFNMDLLKWWGLKDDLTVSANEFKSKACFEKDRQDLQEPELGITTEKLNSALYRLTTLLNDAKTPALLKGKDSEELKAFYSKDTKKLSEATDCATPHELKGKFVNELFDALKPKDLGLETMAQMTALRKALATRIAEPSETKAMRGAIVNAALATNMSDSERQALWVGLDKATEKWGRHFGYQPLDAALNHVFETIDPQVFSGELEKKKLSLYNTASQPVMENLQRVFAVQAALPGNPSVYLPDLFAQGGSEWTKNVFVQNRNLVRVDKLQDDVEFKKFYQEVGKIFGARSNPETLKAYPELQALNNGAIIPITPDDTSGILPIVRDNGKHQVITLVNTGTTKELDFNNKAGFGKEAGYPVPERPKMGESKKYQPDLSELGLRNGTTYQDVNSQEWFKVSSNRLHPANDVNAGVSVPSWRMLVRKTEPGKG